MKRCGPGTGTTGICGRGRPPPPGARGGGVGGSGGQAGRGARDKRAAYEAELARRQARREEVEAALRKLTEGEQQVGTAQAMVEQLGRTIAELSLKRAGLGG